MNEHIFNMLFHVAEEMLICFANNFKFEKEARVMNNGQVIE